MILTPTAYKHKEGIKTPIRNPQNENGKVPQSDQGDLHWGPGQEQRKAAPVHQYLL